MSDFLRPCGLQNTRLPCPSLSPGVYSDSCPMSQWCHLNISSSAALFSFCHRSFPALGSFPMSQLFASGDQSIGASASFLPMNIHGWFPLGLTGLISLQSKELSRVFSSTAVQRGIPGSASKNSPANVLEIREAGSIPDLERSLEKGITTRSSILAWRSQGQRSLASYSPYGHTELNVTEAT